MKVLIFLVARWRRLFCSSRQRSRTLHGRDGDTVTPGPTGPGHTGLRRWNVAVQPGGPEVRSRLQLCDRGRAVWHHRASGPSSVACG